MKKILTSLVLGVLLIMPVIALAETDTEVAQSPDMVYQVINVAINWIFAVLMIGAVFVIIIAAFTFLTSAGDPEKVAKARNYILYAIVAIVVAFLAKAVIMLVAKMVGVDPGNFF